MPPSFAVQLRCLDDFAKATAKIIPVGSRLSDPQWDFGLSARSTAGFGIAQVHQPAAKI